MKIISNIHSFSKEIFYIVRSPPFILLTVVGNGLICLNGIVFYYLEKDSHPLNIKFMDAIWWSFATATTTGNTNIIPLTFAGKILGIFLMLMGMALFAMYTGLFAEVILAGSRRKL